MAQKDFTLSIIHKIPDTIRMPLDSIRVHSLEPEYLRELGFYFAADLETADSLNKYRFILSTKENRGNTWGLDLDFLQKTGENSYKIDAETQFPSAMGLYYYGVYDEINERHIFAGKYAVIPLFDEDTPEEVYIAFKANPSLEFLIATNSQRSTEYEINIETKSDSFNVKSPKESVKFQFAGNIRTKEDLSTKKLKIQILSNYREQFENFSTLSSKRFKMKSKVENVYNFDFKASYKLTPGLYYFLLEDVDSGKIYYANKFIVREEN
ncbi:MAG: hypothetical protein ACI85O_002934 [Saprospiraceae bacterium]